ncbi:MAG TPA: hypothetical protein VM818_19255 [Vicinamibacterales bacterium]|nr:hypothetical protein [Vicinamibacterales bacterium]
MAEQFSRRASLYKIQTSSNARQNGAHCDTAQARVCRGTCQRWRALPRDRQFVDFQNDIFTGNFVGSGAAVGPTTLGGVRAPVGSVALGFEIRYQAAEGELPDDQGFAGTTIDLGGLNYLFATSFRL